MKHYKYLLFDLDGTLTESGRGIINSVLYALKKNGIDETDREKLWAFVGPPLTDSFQKYYGMTREQSLHMVDDYREYYLERGWKENLVYEGIPEVLESLRAQGRRLIVATSKPETSAKKILAYFQLDSYFDLIAGATMDESRNRKDQVIAYALRQMGTAENILMVGDRSHDVEGARENGLLCIGVLYGYGSREELEEAGAAAICPEVRDLPAVIAALEKASSPLASGAMTGDSCFCNI
ncbi:MAG: HAD-IA family hydrolase [Lachnospiraceae bacterium]|nr:HAD-IA family hydrolase [Lachnospiraceae bacterium]